MCEEALRLSYAKPSMNTQGEIYNNKSTKRENVELKLYL